MSVRQPFPAAVRNPNTKYTHTRACLPARPPTTRTTPNGNPAFPEADCLASNHGPASALPTWFARRASCPDSPRRGSQPEDETTIPQRDRFALSLFSAIFPNTCCFLLPIASRFDRSQSQLLDQTSSTKRFKGRPPIVSRVNNTKQPRCGKHKRQRTPRKHKKPNTHTPHRQASLRPETRQLTMAQIFLDVLYSFGNCLNCFPGSPTLKINNRSFKILRLLGEVSSLSPLLPEGYLVSTGGSSRLTARLVRGNRAVSPTYT